MDIKTSLPFAALLGGTMGHVLDYDDVHGSMRGHGAHRDRSCDLGHWEQAQHYRESAPLRHFWSDGKHPSIMGSIRQVPRVHGTQPSSWGR
jgi:hypothetical protein